MIPPEVYEEAKKWPMSIEVVAQIFRDFEDEDLRHLVLEAEAYGNWPMRMIAAIEQRARRQERYEKIVSGETSRKLQHWRDTIPRGRYHP